MDSSDSSSLFPHTITRLEVAISVLKQFEFHGYASRIPEPHECMDTPSEGYITITPEHI